MNGADFIELAGLLAVNPRVGKHFRACVADCLKEPIRTQLAAPFTS
jgi:hypothetical protein